MKSTLARFIDDLILAAAVWLLSALVALYFVPQLYLVVIIATVVTMGVSLIFRFRHKKTKQAMQDRMDAEASELHFLLRSEEYSAQFCLTALCKRYKAERDGGCIIIGETVVAPCLSEPLSLRKIVNFYTFAMERGAKTLVILSFKTEKFPIDIKAKLTGLRLEIFTSDRTFHLLKSLDSVPPKEPIARTNKLAELVATALSPKRARAYLFTVFALLFGAYFSMLSIYFIVMSAVCLALAILCKLDAYQRIKKARVSR